MRQGTESSRSAWELHSQSLAQHSCHTQTRRHMHAHTDLHTGASYTKVRLNRNQEVELKESEEMDVGGKESVEEENLRWRLSRARGKHCRVGNDNKGSSPASGKESRQQR